MTSSWVDAQCKCRAPLTSSSPNTAILHQIRHNKLACRWATRALSLGPVAGPPADKPTEHQIRTARLEHAVGARSQPGSRASWAQGGVAGTQGRRRVGVLANLSQQDIWCRNVSCEQALLNEACRQAAAADAAQRDSRHGRGCSAHISVSRLSWTADKHAACTPGPRRGPSARPAQHL